MDVPFLNVKAAYLELKDELDAAYHRVMNSGCYILGEEVEAFEEEFAAYCHAKHCVSVGNGLDALHLTLRAHDIGPGDEVIVPAHTFIATWLSVSHAGATPVAIDVDPRTHNIDANLLPRAITPRTRAVIAVHLYGLPADMDPLLQVAEHHRLTVIEDAAQAHGARYKGRRIGKSTGAACFSFYPGKNLGAVGDAGAVTTDDDETADRLRLLRNYGTVVKYQHEAVGFNSRLDPLQAAFLRVKLNWLDRWNERRRTVARRYLAEMSDVPGITLPYVPAWAEPAWHIFAVRCAERAAFQRRLRERGIGTLIHYPVPPHLSSAYGDGPWRRGDFPVTEELTDSVVSLPMGPHLGERELSEVISGVRTCA